MKVAIRSESDTHETFAQSRSTPQILWGSFPLPVDKQGYIRIRMIPFLPWPETPFV